MRDKTVKLFKKGIHIILNVLFYSVIAICLVVLVNKWVLRNNDQSLFGYRAVCVLSGSMEDTLSVGDAVIIKEDESYFVNDIISFREGSEIITHRIIAITDTGFMTKGDANNTVDSKTVRKENIIGKEVLIIPWIGYIRIAVMSPVGLIMILTGCCGLYLINRSIEEREETEDEKE